MFDFFATKKFNLKEIYSSESGCAHNSYQLDVQHIT